MDYKELYEKEHEKNQKLTERVTSLEAKCEMLEFALNRIKGNKLWRWSTPLRKLMHWAIRQRNRLRNCGSVKGFFEMLAYKGKEKKAMKRFGTASFPKAAEAKAERETVFPMMPKISILVPLWNNRREFQIEMIESVRNQTYQNWELCLADGSDEEHAYIGDICREYAEKDNAECAKAGRSGNRIVYKKLEKNTGISGNTNACLELASGEYIGLLDQDDILHPSVLFEYVRAINEKGADYLYSDEVTFKNNDINHMITLHFKPDFALDNLRANNYICHFSVFAKSLLEGDELFRSQFDGSQDHDMTLRLTDRAKSIVHIPRIMYYWRCHSGSTAGNIEAKPYAVAAAKGAVSEHLRKHGFDHFEIISSRAFETIFRLKYEVLGNPRVSIVIPNKDHVVDLRRCVDSIFEKSTYDNYEIVIVENNSTTQEIKDYYDELSDRENVRVVIYTGEFNYSAICNLGVAHAEGEYILLLNNDTQVISADWIEELLMYAQREDVGAVGAKLFFGDNYIQHAGVVLGLGAHRVAGHGHYRVNRESLGYMGRLCYANNVSAVTGACLMVKKSLYEEVGGLDENFAVALNDVDFCLKLREKNLLNVFTPFAQLYHFESITRGSDQEGESAKRFDAEVERFRNRWQSVIDAGDPYYNPNLSLDRGDFALKM